MKRALVPSKRGKLLIGGVVLLTFCLSAFVGMAQGHAGHGAESGGGKLLEHWFNIFELPFLALCITYAFLTAKALKGGVFGSGMNLMAWGFLVMAVGHVHMQLDHATGFNLFNTLLGEMIGQVAWIAALISTWALSGLGFYKLYKASKSI